MHLKIKSLLKAPIKDAFKRLNLTIFSMHF